MPSGGEITGHEILSTRIPTGANSGVKEYVGVFRKTSAQSVRRLYIVATHNDSTVFDAAAGDSFEVREVLIEHLKFLASYLPHNITHSKWYDRATRQHDITLLDIQKVKDEVADHGEWTPSLGAGFTISNAEGHYRIFDNGSMCYAHGRFVHDSNQQSSGHVYISGLPLSAHNHGGNLLSFGQIRGSQWNSIGTTIYCSILSGENRLALRHLHNNADEQITGDKLRDGGWYYFEIIFPLD